MSIDYFNQMQDRFSPIISLECTAEDFIENQEAFREIIPKGSYVDTAVNDDGETYHLTIVIPKEYGEITDQLFHCATMTLAGQKVTRTWLN